MIAELGLAAVWLAAAFAGVQLAVAAQHRDVAAIRAVATVQAGLAVIALFAGDWRDPLSLSVTLLALAGGATAWRAWRVADPTLIVALGAQAAVALAGYGMLLVDAVPVAAPALRPDAGSSWEVVPLVAGYVALCVAASFAIGGLTARDPDAARAGRSWVLAAWVCLTLGLTAGGDWGAAGIVAPAAWLAATALLVSRRPTGDRQVWLDRSAWPLAAAGATLAAAVTFAPAIGWWPLLGLSFATGLAAAAAQPLIRTPRRPLDAWGVGIAQLGIAVALAGFAADHAFTRAATVAAQVGRPEPIGPFAVRFDGIRPLLDERWSALEAHLTVRRPGKAAFSLAPQQRFLREPPRLISPRASATLWPGRFEATLGAPQGAGRWRLQLWWRPFAALWPAGGAIAVFGGLLALVGGWWRERPRPEAI